MKPYWEQHLPATYQPDALIRQDLLRIDSSALELVQVVVASARDVVGFERNVCHVRHEHINLIRNTRQVLCQRRKVRFIGP